MALDIRPPAANTTNKSSSVSSKQSAKAGSSSTDLFATHLAQSAKSSSKQTSAPKQQSASKPQRDKSPSASNKQDGSTQAAAADRSNKSGATAGAKSSKASAAKANIQPSKNSSASAASDSPTSDSAASASDDSPVAGSPNTNGTSKGRAPAKGAAGKTSAPQTAANGQTADAAASAADAADDPTTDTSNSSGLSLLQLLAQASEGEDSSAPSTDSAADTGTDGSADAADEDSSQTDLNALTSAMLSQAFAAGFAPPAAAQTAAAALGTSSNAAATADAGTDDTAGAIDANSRSSGSSAQELVGLLARDLAAQGQGKTDSDAPRSDVPLGIPATKKGSAEAASAANNTSPTPESAAQSLAQLGTASHFSRETNLTELKAPLGSSAWNDELGGHLTWMTHRGLESGSLKVSPEHLGPVEVQITVQNGDASVWFGATHPDTRAALEQALPRLRELFANQGLTLTDSGVSREPPRNQTRSAAPHNPSVSAISGTSEVGATSSARVSLGLIDTYA